MILFYIFTKHIGVLKAGMDHTRWPHCHLLALCGALVTPQMHPQANHFPLKKTLKEGGVEACGSMRRATLHLCSRLYHSQVCAGTKMTHRGTDPFPPPSFLQPCKLQTPFSLGSTRRVGAGERGVVSSQMSKLHLFSQRTWGEGKESTYEVALCWRKRA